MNHSTESREGPIFSRNPRSAEKVLIRRHQHLTLQYPGSRSLQEGYVTMTRSMQAFRILVIHAVALACSSSEIGAQETQSRLLSPSPVGVVNRGARDWNTGGVGYIPQRAHFPSDTIYATISDVRRSTARKRHAVIGAVSGGVVGGGLAVAFAPGCSAHETGPGACAYGKVLAVGASTVIGILVGAVGGYFWPVQPGR